MKIEKPKTEKEKELLSQLLLLDKEIRRREAVGHPGHYGMPDLLFPKGFKPGYYAEGLGENSINEVAGNDLQDGWLREPLDHEETDEEYEKRQNLALKRFITESLFISKDGRKIYVKVIPQQLQFIADIFFKRVSKAILWKPRGGGGSLSAAVLIWILLVYRKVSVLDLAGSGDQAKIVYDYVKEFWETIPGLSEGLLDGDPLSQITRLKTGAEVKCTPSTEKQARGKHYSVIFVDEACQEDPRPERAMRAAIQGALSEYDPVVVLLSTFHVPHGMFQEYWDGYEDKGFTRYKWSCLDPDTWIQTDSGYKRIKEVVFGDQVIAEDGRFHLVLDSWGSVPTEKMVRVRSVGWNQGFSCTASHLVKVARIAKKYRGFEVVEKDLWVKAVDLDPAKHVLQVPVPKFSSELFSKDFGYRDDRYNSGWVNFSLPMSSELAEFLGMWLGDGNIDGDKVCCALGDGRYKERYKYLVKRLFNRKVYIDKDPKNQRARFAHRGLVRYLSICYVEGKKALPWGDFLRFSPSCLLGLLKGLGVSDGSIDKNFRFGQVSPILSQQFWMASTALGLFPNVYRSRQTDSNIDGRVISGEDWWAQQISGKTAYSYGLVKPLKRHRRQLIISDGDDMYVPLKGVEFEEAPELVWDLAVEGVPSFSLIWGVVHNCLDTMCACQEGLDTATEDDPKALEYCKNCFLTEKKMVKDASGQFEIETYTGCNGQARDAKGWMTFDQICEQKKLNIGTTIFECEFLCVRPQYASSVYPPELIEKSLTDPLEINPETDKLAVGIDWGIQTQGSLAINMIARMVDYVYVAEIVYSDHKLVSDVADLLNGWREQFGNFPVLADASHPFNNAELEEAGFEIRPISFGSWKKMGIENVSKFFVFNRIRINKNLETLIDQLKKFRRNETTGNIIKKDDHGPDSLMVSMLNFRFEDEFGPDISKAAVLEQQTRLLEEKKGVLLKKDKVSFSEDGMAKAVTTIPDFVPQEALRPKKEQKNILVF